MNDIAKLNDDFRKSFIGGEVLLSAGIAAMSSEDKANIVSLVQNFDSFNDDNDVYGEHDFFSIDYKGNKIFAKIDYYDLNYEFMSENPANPDITNRVLTILLSCEY
ncbi:MAG: DUF3768 domain-containing protein [Alphaproteobacteria bacterium]|nr:DUF3768 domain-containing protein [Alphaproteobacteria bacterium]